jgi:hypothetical protein
MYRCICVCMCVCMCVCIYIYRGRQSVRAFPEGGCAAPCPEEHRIRVNRDLIHSQKRPNTRPNEPYFTLAYLKSPEFVIRSVFTTAPVPRNRCLFIVVYVGAICALRVLLHEAKGHLFPAVSEIHTRIPTVERRPRPLVAVSVFSC